jgi:RNA polymerase sigma-70 factor (ECF subfamily)
MRWPARERSVARVNLHEPTVSQPLDERDLVDALRRGDERVFAALVDRNSAAMLRVARQYVSTRAAAEEVVRETWLGVLRGLEGFEGSSTLRMWTFRILMNTARARRELERGAVTVPPLAPESGPSVEPARFLPPDDPDWPEHWATAPPSLGGSPGGEAETVVEAAIAALPELEGLVVTLRDVEGWGADEVCALLGLSDGSQRRLLHRGRSRVRAALEAHVEASVAA